MGEATSAAPLGARAAVAALMLGAAACSPAAPLGASATTVGPTRQSAAAAGDAPPAPSSRAAADTSPCEGHEVSLERAFESAACRVDAADIPRAALVPPKTVVASLEANPSALEYKISSRALYRIRNDGAETTTIYLPAEPAGTGEHHGAYLTFRSTLVEPAGRIAHFVGLRDFKLPDDGRPQLVRITLSPGGSAVLTIFWCPERTVGSAPPRTPISHQPLDPGPYRLRVSTPATRFDPPPTPITLLPGGDAHGPCHPPGEEPLQLDGRAEGRERSF